MHTMSTFQDDCFRSIEMIKKMNMKSADDLEKLIFNKLMLNISKVNIYT